jgi:Flp pilus assembly protein TadG
MSILNSARLMSKRRGQVTVLVAISLIALLGVTAIAVDGALLMVNRRAVQSAADSAALAAAIQMYNDWTSQTAAQQGMDPNGTAATSAQSTATDNGFKNGTNSVTVTCNIPPQSGNYTNLAGYAEVIITMQQTRYFSVVFGSGTLTVRARAVARGSQVQPPIGILVLNGNHSNSFNVSATGNANVGNGRIVVDSTSNAGLHLSAAGNVTASSIQTVTTTSPGYSASSTGTASPAPVYGATYFVSDPLASFATANAPSTTGLTAWGGFSANKLPQAGGSSLMGSQNGPTGWKIPSGYYSSDFTIGDNNYYNPFTGQVGSSSTGAIVVNSAGSGYTSAPTVTLSGGGGSGATATATVSGGQLTGVTITSTGSGYTSSPTISLSGGGGTGATVSVGSVAATYYLEAGLFYFGHNVTVNGVANVDGSAGVLLYLNGGGMTISAGGSVTLSPMSYGTAPTGPQSLSIWQNSSDSSNLTLSASGGLNITSGILYVPNTSAQMNLSASGGTTAYAGAQVIVGMLQLSGSGNISVNTGSTLANGRQLYLVE